MQYCNASQAGAGLLVPPIAEHKAGMGSSFKSNSTVTVQIGAIIDESGRTTNVRAVRGSEAMTVAAMKALQEWHFEPAQLNGKAVSVKILMGIPVR
jgi:TonB family protein